MGKHSMDSNMVQEATETLLPVIEPMQMEKSTKTTITSSLPVSSVVEVVKESTIDYDAAHHSELVILEEKLLSLQNSQMMVDGKGGKEKKRIPTPNVLLWCQEAATHLFHDSTKPVLSVWGAKVMRSMFLILLERNDLMSPSLSEWLQTQLMPCLFPSVDGGIEAAHGELSYLLLKCLFESISKGNRMISDVENNANVPPTTKASKRPQTSTSNTSKRSKNQTSI